MHSENMATGLFVSLIMRPAICRMDCGTDSISDSTKNPPCVLIFRLMYLGLAHEQNGMITRAAYVFSGSALGSVLEAAGGWRATDRSILVNHSNRKPSTQIIIGTSCNGELKPEPVDEKQPYLPERQCYQEPLHLFSHPHVRCKCYDKEERVADLRATQQTDTIVIE